MTDPQDPAAPLQGLPSGMPRRFAEYRPVDRQQSSPPPTNVGGYDELLAHFHSNGTQLPRSQDGLAAIDNLIDSIDDKTSLSALVRPIGMFYGDVLTHTIPGAHWEVIQEGYPLVRVTAKTAVDVVQIAIRRMVTADPTLLQNFSHVMALVRPEP
ncbi:DUF6278 family protein [Arthrobacter sp. 92]|uniref:DUF6278 family protein n=1 Tax=Arthrobacter sp. 92 TaxID=3418175 RepID=UPI003D064CC7